MKFFGFLILVLLGFPAFAQQPPTPPAHRSQQKADHEAVNRQLKAMEAAFARNDMKGIADLYAEDAEMMDNRGLLVRGRQPLEAYWLGLKDKGRGWTLTAAETGGQGDLVYQIGTSDLRYANRQGAENRSVTHFVLLWKKQPDGSFKIYRDFLSDLDYEKAKP